MPAKMEIAAEPTRSILTRVKEAHRFRAVAVVLLLSASALSSGCGGFSGSHSVSPATLLLPGLMKHDPAPVRPVGPTSGDATVQVASAAAASPVRGH